MSRWTVLRWTIWAICLFAAAAAHGWETATPKEFTVGEEWESIYASFALPNDIDATYDTDAFWKTNEHARLAHLALKDLGVAQFYSFTGDTIQIIDLNASLFRRHPLSGGRFARSPTASPLEERLLPQPAHYAGLPDFSYTMYDWINKNVDCPPGLPPSEEKGERGCHSFEGWMGALNSSHFGTQSTLWFKHLHKIAIKLAKRAREMREKLERQGKETLDAYRDFVVEAEHEALAFEGYAQHFLQDRWSIGHMWERWNAADYGQLPSRKFLDNIEVAAATGLLHGSESVTGVPDPMSSPYLGLAPYGKLAEKWSHTGKKWSLVSKLYGDSAYIVPTWRHGKGGTMDKTLAEVLQREESFMDQTPHPGVGDHRLADMLDGRFGEEYGFPNRPLNAEIQKKQLLRCMTAGWTDVIKGFGRSKASGGYGLSGARLPPYSRGMTEDGNLLIGCFDDWATNGAMALGWSDPVSTFATAVRLAIAFVEEAIKGSSAAKVASRVTGESIPRFMHNGRLAWGKVTFRIWRHALANPNGTNLARGDIGDFGKIGHGGKYPALPGYIEPEDLDRLPDEVTKTGRDKISIYGFFNRAHADWWCEDNLGLMEELRASRNKRRQAACVLLADRFYAGTDRAYKGGNREDRTHNKKASGKRILPICSICGSRKIPKAGYDERIPITLAPGYVSKPYRRSRYGFSTNSVENWCRKVPVLDLMKEPKHRDNDVVALVRDVKKNIFVTGANLGNRTGKIVLDGEIVIQKSDVLDWDDSSIRFRLNKKQKVGRGEHVLTLTRADGVGSVGRFILKVNPDPPTVVSLRAKETGQVYYDFPGGISKRISPGRIRVEVRFNQDMDRKEKAKVAIPGLKVTVKGEWQDDEVWTGEFFAPSGPGFDRYIGVHAVHIIAKSRAGKWLDSDPDKDGAQPDTEHRFRFGRPPPAPPTFDLTGCWSGLPGERMVIRQRGLSLAADASVRDTRGKVHAGIPFTGKYRPPRVELRHLYTRETLKNLKPGMEEGAYRALLKAGASLTLRLQAFGGMTYGGVEGASTLGGGEPAQDYWAKLTVLPVSPPEWKTRVRWDAQPTQNPTILSKLVREEITRYEYFGLRVTDESYQRDLDKLDGDQPFWLRAEGHGGCDVLRERLHIHVHPENDVSRVMNVTLLETGLDTNEFRSPKQGVQLQFDLARGRPTRLRFWSKENPEIRPVWLMASAAPPLPGRPAVPKIQPPSLPAGSLSPLDVGLDYHLGSNREDLARMEAKLARMRKRAIALENKAAHASHPDEARQLRQEVENLKAQIRLGERNSADLEKWIHAMEAGRFAPARKPTEAAAKLERQIKSFRDSAAALRKKAAGWKDPTDRDLMLRQARQYDAIADRLEEMRGAVSPKASPAPAAASSRRPDAIALRNQAFVKSLRSIVTARKRGIKKFEESASAARSRGEVKQAKIYDNLAEDTRKALRQHLEDSRKIFEKWGIEVPAWVRGEIRSARRKK